MIDLSTTQNDDQPDEQFTVLAEAADGRLLIATYMNFARLIDDIVVPYESRNPFIIDGVLVDTKRLKRLKIIRQTQSFNRAFQELHWNMRAPHVELQKQRLYAEQYHIRIEAIIRESGEDVTSQVIKAFDKAIRPSLKDYLPRREVLIRAAMEVFVEGIKALRNY